jgi:hypothetical protein
VSEKKPAKKKGKGKDAAAEDAPLTLGSHPRAAPSIRRWKARAGLAAFALSALASQSAGTPMADTLLRAVGAGIVGNVAGWFLAVAVWRQLVRAEMKLAIDRRAAMVRTGRAPARGDV